MILVLCCSVGPHFEPYCHCYFCNLAVESPQMDSVFMSVCRDSYVSVWPLHGFCRRAHFWRNLWGVLAVRVKLSEWPVAVTSVTFCFVSVSVPRAKCVSLYASVLCPRHGEGASQGGGLPSAAKWQSVEGFLFFKDLWSNIYEIARKSYFFCLSIR